MLICGDPGSRLGTVAAWLQDSLIKPSFEPGQDFSRQIKFKKCHTDFQNLSVSNYNGLKIRIRPSFKKLSTHLHLFLIKNVYTQIKNFSKNPYDLETATKLTESAKEWFLHDEQVDNDLYDIVLNFEDTYNIDKLIELYQTVNNYSPEKKYIANLEATNKLNDPVLDKNCACVISSLVLEKEHRLNLLENDRLWCFPGTYNSVAVGDLYDTINELINHKNYNKQDNYDF